ncbi:MAG TPA: hypothetical protein VHH36_01600 [Candidatus Thermoplasmatota archaeon]|nr:hypothetical protein [Candidatus Thermoplasmatota archaeon]
MARGKIEARGKGPGRPPLTQAEKVYNAVQRGAQDAREIARRARVPVLHVHPLLNRLRKAGAITGFTGALKVIAPPRRR